MRNCLKTLLLAGWVMVMLTSLAAAGQLFDPGKKFTIYKKSALLGDPAFFISVGSGRQGGTYVQTSLVPGKGLQVIASLVELAQAGQPGSGDALVLTQEQTQTLIGLLRKAPKWSEIAKANAVGDYSKLIGYVQGSKGDDNRIEVVFVSLSDNSTAVQIEHYIAGRAKKFRFKIRQGEKWAEQLQHFLNVAIAETTAMPENRGDPEKDKLFK